MKKKIVLSLMMVIIIILNMTFASIFYIDVLNHWAEDEIHKATNNLNVFYGYEDGTFKPNNFISRNEFIALISRILIEANLIEKPIFIYENYEISIIEKKITDEKNQDEVGNSGLEIGNANQNELYDDLLRENWEYQDVQILEKYLNSLNASLKNVFEAEKLEGSKNITRLEAIKLIGFFVAPSIENVESLEYDDFIYDKRYFDSLIKVLDSKIINGYDDGYLRLENNLTRAEAAKIINKFFDEVSSFSNTVFNSFETIEIDKNDKYSFFNANRYNNKYRKAVISLEYLSVVKKIPYNEYSLYDPYPYDTLREMLNDDKNDKLGLYYYLIEDAKTEDERKKFKDNLSNLFLENEIVFEDSILIVNRLLEGNKDLNLEDLLFMKLEKSIENENQLMQFALFKGNYYLEKNNFEKLLEIYSDESIEKLEDENNIFMFKLNRAYTYYLMTKYDYSKKLLNTMLKELKNKNNLKDKLKNEKIKKAIRKNMYKEEIFNRNSININN